MLKGSSDFPYTSDYKKITINMTNAFWNFPTIPNNRAISKGYLLNSKTV